MRPPSKGSLALLVLAAMLGVRCGPAPEPRAAREIASPFAFTDVTAEAGIAFNHSSGADGRKYMPETMGSGGGFFDADGDGLLDILLLNGRNLSKPAKGQPTAALYLNRGDGTFRDATRGSGLDVPLCAMGCAFGDYDNDGLDDVFITTALEPNRLFRNLGKGKFLDVTERAGVGDRRWGTSCAWLDYDRDGWLDLFVCNYVRYRTIQDDQWCSNQPGKKTYCSPEVYEGEACILYRNLGNGAFADVSDRTGVGAHKGKALGLAIVDLEDDGYPDVVVANDKHPNFLFHNRPAREGARSPRVFADVGMRAGIALDATGLTKAGMGIDAAELHEFGGLCILISNFSNEGLSLFARAGPQHFADRSAESGLASASWLYLGFGLFFADLDNDGDLDAFVANGHVQDDIGAVQPNLGYAERNLLFENLGNGQFREVGLGSGSAFHRARVSRGAACADYDRDGDLDILVTNNNGPAELLRNDTRNDNRWLRVETQGAMVRSGRFQRDRQGTKLTIRAAGRSHVRALHSGSSYLCDARGPAHFGLGRTDRVEEVLVQSPSGKTQRRGPVNSKSELTVRTAD